MGALFQTLYKSNVFLLFWDYIQHAIIKFGLHSNIQFYLKEYKKANNINPYLVDADNIIVFNLFHSN